MLFNSPVTSPISKIILTYLCIFLPQSFKITSDLLRGSSFLCVDDISRYEGIVSCVKSIVVGDPFRNVYVDAEGF